MPARPVTAPDAYAGFSIYEMEQLLRKDGRPASREPQTARAVLEENRIAATRRHEERARVKAEGRVQEVALLENERAAFDDDIHKERSRRDSARALSDHYRDEIARRAEERRPQLKHATEAAEFKEFFPFTYGEELEKQRRDLALKNKKDLLDHLALVNPTPREDPLQQKPVRKYGEQTGEPRKPSEAHSFNDNYPIFLKKAKEYATRFADPKVGRVAMQQRVAATYESLQRDYAAKLAERDGQGLGVYAAVDGLEAEAQAASLEQRRKNAAAIREQMEEQRRKREDEKKQARAEHHGYYGPKDKRFTVQQSLAKDHASDLRRQIEVDKARVKDLREYELAQDRLYQESHVQALVNDQQHARIKEKKSKNLLKQSWDQQVKMRQVRAIVQNV